MRAPKDPSLHWENWVRDQCESRCCAGKAPAESFPRRYLQRRLHLGESRLGLIEETIDNTLTEVAVVIIVHLEDLFKGAGIDELLHILEPRWTRLMLDNLLSL